MKLRVLAVVVALLVVAACSDDETTADATATSGGTSAPVTESVTEPEEGGAATPAAWEEHVPGGDCQCADGSEYRFYSRAGDPEKVMLYFQGGGACFSADTCRFDSGTYISAITLSFEGGDGIDASGIFDFADESNPFRDWTIVFVPYCTGDVHIGDNVHTYGEDLTVNHKGFVNASSALDHLVATYPDATEVLVTGSSAGGVPSPLFGGLVADELPDARVSVLADASGAYPDNPPVNLAIGGFWGTFENVPDWPESAGLAPEDYSIPGLFVQTGLHNPAVRLARYDNAYDEVQQSFTALSGLSTDDLLTLIETNEANIEAAGVPVASYIAPGDDHTILLSDAVYTLEVGGVPFLDWLTRFQAGEDVADVRCTDCAAPAATTDG
ncbi:MAG: pectinacetylesterase family protein [Acidimicrobiales bacterium]|nr:pectinacetylesterase family protein [Acidimicrobiales bacterium]